MHMDACAWPAQSLSYHFDSTASVFADHVIMHIPAHAYWHAELVQWHHVGTCSTAPRYYKCLSVVQQPFCEQPCHRPIVHDLHYTSCRMQHADAPHV
jgi:hypothetical protein